jgi:hypothetical protein
MTQLNTMQPLCGSAASCKIVLGAFINNVLVDSVAFNEETQVEFFKGVLLDCYAGATIMRKLDHKPTRIDYHS